MVTPVRGIVRRAKKWTGAVRVVIGVKYCPGRGNDDASIGVGEGIMIEYSGLVQASDGGVAKRPALPQRAKSKQRNQTTG